VTSADTKSEPDSADASSESPLQAGTGLVIRVASLSAAGFLVVGLALYGASAASLRWPDLLLDAGLDGGPFSYGRLAPAGVNALLFGWLTLGLASVVLHAVPRLSGAPLSFPLVALGVVGLMAAGAGVGMAAILLGEGDGGRYLEMPWFADAALVAAYFGLAVIVRSTARRGDRDRLPVAAWFLVVAPWMLFLSFAAGSVPGLEGLPGEIQGAFTGTAVTGLWVAMAAVGGGYHLISRLVPGVGFHERLGNIGFWSLVLTWAWTAGRAFQYGPVGDWVGTLPVLFGAGVVVASITILTDWVLALRGRWGAIPRSPSLQLLVAGSAFFVIGPAIGFVGSLRSVSAVLQFTPWDAAYEQATLLGAFTLWAMAAIAYALPAESGRSWTPWMGRVVVWPAVVGVALSVGSRLVGGLQQGYAWLAGVQSGEYQNLGEGFVNSSAPLAGADLAQAIGLGLLGFSGTVFALLAIRFAVAGGQADRRPAGVSPVTGRLSVAIRGSTALFLVAALGAFAFPAIDSDGAPTLLADGSRRYEEGSLEDRGRDLYISEGCWYCHTQQVRAVVTDVGLGRVSEGGDYAHDPAGTLGFRRVGPDLAHTAGREQAGSASFVLNHLIDPRATRPWSVMPSYAYLSPDELTALAAYVAGLE
jgi:cbb3-type cytochrome oxidase subunit 1